MKKLSRYLAVLLIVLMLASMAVSCKKGPADDDEGVVETDGNGGGGDGTEDGSTDGTGNDDGNGGGNGGTGDKTNSTGGKNNGGTNSSGGGTGTGDRKQNQGGASKEEDKTYHEGGAYAEDKDGNVTNTKTDATHDAEYRYDTPITNDNGFIPDEEQGLEKSERRATEASKYNFDQNPLINRDRQQNKTWKPSFDINETGFVRAGTKLSDLKGKTLTFFTADNFAAWSYRNAKGETVDEWAWFKQLKSELGLNIKYTVKQHQESVNSALQSMNAGKNLDIVYTNHVVFPASLCISRSITDVININNLGSSPGVCKNTMDCAKWGNTLRLVAPIGCVDVIWYNQTLTQELNLSDPHLMWEQGVWDWNTFSKYQLSVPKTNKEGQNLIAFVQWPSNASYIWPSTNGSPRIYIDANADRPALLNNWTNPKTMEAWEFITGVCNSVNYDASAEPTPGNQRAHVGMYNGTTIMSATMYTQVYRDTEYSKHVQINWVPYPKSPNENGQEVCQYYGFGMMLPRKTKNADNVNPALKFMELWATRFTETIFDNLNTFEYYNFNYKQRKQYFDFVTKNVVFALAMNDFSGCSLDKDTNFFKCFTGDATYNVKTEAEKGANIVYNYIVDSMKFGQ